MMQLVKLHPEVVKFLDQHGTIHFQDGEKTFVVNGIWYTPTDEENIYITQFIE